jgi:hypothetical protein
MGLEPQALWIHPFPLSDADRELIVVAKKKLNLNFLVIPRAAFARDLDGYNKVVTKGRVLCLREHSPMFVDHAFVADPTNETALLAGLEWALTDKFDSRASTEKSMWDGFGYTEIPDSRIRYENLSNNLRLNDGRKVPMFVEE